ncbi:hypothetical protein HID58_025549 [Brassica napus]|uniref:DUF1985 domain-containing protein n=1 Tax=Brassica napus TaxID=3708 RepID=A0ABQ8CLG2_BRANA|nr:hypothetical protein HID58_025549 [Brassica napus]
MVSARLVDCPDIPEETEMQPNPDMMFAAGEEPIGDTEIRIKYACLALLESVLLPTSLKMKISRDHVEAIKDLDAFFAYPWGRVAFDMLMGSIKERDEIALSQNTIAIKGFVLALQLVMVEAVPALTDVVQDTCSSSESDSEDVDGHGRDIFCKKQTLNPAHARNVDKRIDLLVNSVLVEDPVGRINAGNLVYSDEEHDARVESMLVRISRSHRFNNSDFPSGLKKSDVDRMREVVKSTTKPKRAKKFQSNVQDSETSYIVQVVLEKIKAEVASMERNIKVATSGVEAIEQKVGVYVETLLEKNHSNVSTKEVSVPASHSSPVADVNAMTIQNVLRDISQYSTPPRSNRMSEAGNLTPSNKAHAGSGYVCVTRVLQSCAQSAISENRSRQTPSINEGRKRQPQCLMDEPSFSLGLTQKAFIPVEIPILPTNQVHHQEPIADINVGDNNEEGQSSWRSKRQKTVPSGLVCDYQCAPHVLARLRESQRCIFVIQDISEQTRKYAKLVTKLQGKFVFNILGLAVSAKELLLIVDRPRTYSAKMTTPQRVCLFHGAWRRNEDGHWNFQRKPSDLGYTVMVKPTETVEGLPQLVRERYNLQPETPLVMAYHPPDWLLEPLGTRTPPIYLTTTSQVETMMHIRSWFSELTLCVSSGPEDVAHFQFLSNTTFTIGGATFVFKGLNDKELVASKEILEEIFNDQERVTIYRSHLEIEKAKEEERVTGGSASVSSTPSVGEASTSSPSGSREDKLYLI